MSKPKFVAVTDAAEADALAQDPADLSQPYTVKPNGHLWAEPDELQAWRNGRNQQNRMD